MTYWCYTKPDIYSEASWSQDSHNIETYAVKVLAYETLHMKHSLTYKGKQTKHFKKYVNDHESWITQLNLSNTRQFALYLQSHQYTQFLPSTLPCTEVSRVLLLIKLLCLPSTPCLLNATAILLDTKSRKKEFSPYHNMERSSFIAKIESLIQERVILQEPSHTFQWKKTPSRNRLLGYIWC